MRTTVKTRRKIPFLKADMVKDGEVGTIIGAGERKSSQFRQDGLIIPVEINGGKFILSLNATSEDTLTLSYGDDSGAWVGRSFKVMKMKHNIGGKIIDVIYAEPGLPTPQRQITESLPMEGEKIFHSIDAALEARDKGIIRSFESLGDGRYRGLTK